jgi:alpha-tubulin suppressor-like RCC1 family protein
VPTPLPLVSDVQDLAMGDGFICVATSTNVQCWGDNISRQLGQGGVSTVDILTPVPVMGLGVVDELEVGGQFACVRVGGTVQCWGENLNSQTGEGTTTTDQSLPVTVMGLADAVDITLGEGHGCALRATGVVSCWGDDGVGQLGDSDGNTVDSAVPVDVTGLPAGVVQVAAGQDHTCALAGGDVYCWGEGGYGNLGQGSEADSDTALVVPGVTGIVQIAAGNNYVCALDGAGDMWCWGYSLDGHLGDGGEPFTGLGEVSSPIPFMVESGITNVVASNSMTCIETAAGWSCLGFRASGQLGDGTAVELAVPTPTYFGL